MQYPHGLNVKNRYNENTKRKTGEALWEVSFFPMLEGGGGGKANIQTWAVRAHKAGDA
jgi:hypothetical protein